MKLIDLVTLKRGHLNWFRYPTHNIGTYLGRGVMMVVEAALVTSLVIVIFLSLIIGKHSIRKLEMINHIVKIKKIVRKNSSHYWNEFVKPSS